MLMASPPVVLGSPSWSIPISVALDAQGNAQFNGHISIPAVCSSAPEDTAFLIRIVLPVGFENLYIAFGAVRVP